MVNFVATTRRWYDRGNPRDAGGCYACQIIALKIWKKGQYYRNASRTFGDKESTIKSSCIIRYLVYIVYFINRIYNNCLPEPLKKISHTIIKNIVDEYGDKILDETLDTLLLLKNDSIFAED